MAVLLCADKLRLEDTRQDFQVQKKPGRNDASDYEVRRLDRARQGSTGFGRALAAQSFMAEIALSRLATACRGRPGLKSSMLNIACVPHMTMHTLISV